MDRTRSLLAIFPMLVGIVLLAVPLGRPASAEGPPKCFGKEATIVGTNGHDTLSGTPHRDVIVGRGGRDIIRGRAGSDLICGGRNPLRFTPEGAPRYTESLAGNSGADLIAGGPGPDSIGGNKGNDLMKGGGGPDALLGDGPVSCCREYPGDRDRLFGGTGNDTLHEQAGKSLMRGGGGNDEFEPTDQDERVYGGKGRDRIFGSPGRDLLVGGPGRDKADYGGASRHGGIESSLTDLLIDLQRQRARGFGRDRLSSIEFAETGDGDDRLRGNELANRLAGGRGNDTITGGKGDDNLFGDEENDELDGGRGENTNHGGPGDDVCRNPAVGPRATGCEA